MREFASGATRNNAGDKLEYKGFICPEALTAFAEYMHNHRIQADGQMRDSDNWKKGIPIAVYNDSLIRHVHDYHRLIDGWSPKCPDDGHVLTAKELLCAILFNVQGLLHETLKDEQ